MTGFPPPRELPRVWGDDISGWHYLTVPIPLGSETWRWRTSWSRHLTNALHDAGLAVSRERR